MTDTLHYRTHRPELTLVQLSDLHLSDKTNTHHTLLRLLAHIKRLAPDLLVLTGDLVNHGLKQGYNWLFDTLNHTQIPFVCMAGNHDVTLEIGEHLPFSKRTFKAINADTRLDTPKTVKLTFTTCQWQLLTLNSAVNGEIFGRLSSETLLWLATALSASIPTIIAMHHHPISVGSAWIDAHQLQNSQEFWQLIGNYPHVKAVICGHVHQAHTLPAPTPHPCVLYTCPAVCRQFKPFCDDFTLDTQSAGFRLLTLDNTQTISSNIYRLSHDGSHLHKI